MDHIQIEASIGIILKAKVQDVSSHRPFFDIFFPNLPKQKKIRITIPPPDIQLEIRTNQDFLRRSINLLKDEGLRWTRCWKVSIYQGNPIRIPNITSNLGVSAWLKFLIFAAGQEIDEMNIEKYVSIIEENTD